MRVLLLFSSLAGILYANPDCGKTPIPPHLNISSPHYVNNAIVGGDVATPYSWPWQIVWCAPGIHGGCYLECGGSVIAEGWAITAGHCVYDDMNPKSYEVKAGVFQEKKTDEQYEQVVKVKKIHLHPKYDPDVPAHDIALIELATPLNFSQAIQPVCLPVNDTTAISPPNSAFVTGWGTTSEDGNLSKKLKQVKVPFVDFNTCEKEYPHKIEEDVMVCAGQKGLDSCQGDSGGPLVVQSSDGRWFEYGIVSFGYGCAEKHEPGIYSRVTAYCDFIATTTNNVVTCQAS